ncbi:toxin [Streptomyces sp. NBC_01750]|uniref:toxin n=2 Tax=unclassified Streptomyces TaxID=2593676 RepID=UPI002DDC74B6|nr:toxin [Streptomyces sp. NBC_01750]WSD30527.1 toxin [Streptomyces sp. NBC_01750]WSD37535.1 toxin [Streptomyces sp. NBC_01750]
MRYSQRRSLAHLRRSCEARLAALMLPMSCDIAGLCARLSERRGRPLHLIPIAMRAAQPCGLWIASDAADLVIFEAKTTRPHQDHIIVHELAHIVCEHRSSSSLDDATARLVFPDLNPELVRNMLQRSNYSDAQEQEAEMMASLILATQNDGIAVPPTPALGALSEALGITQRGRRL